MLPSFSGSNCQANSFLLNYNIVSEEIMGDCRRRQVKSIGHQVITGWLGPALTPQARRESNNSDAEHAEISEGRACCKQ